MCPQARRARPRRRPAGPYGRRMRRSRPRADTAPRAATALIAAALLTGCSPPSPPDDEGAVALLEAAATPTADVTGSVRTRAADEPRPDPTPGPWAQPPTR